MLLLGILLAAAPAPTPTPVAADIYRSALRRLTTLPQPPYIDATEHRIVVSQTPNGNVGARVDERILFDSGARRECVMILPYSDKSEVVFSQSFFAPDMWLVHHSSQTTQSTVPAQGFAPDLSDLKTIASVVSIPKPSYDITLAGVDKLPDGGIAYHLRLKPLRDPRKHNLRELWVNGADFDILRAVVDGEYAPDPSARIVPSTVTEDFGQVGPYWVVVHRTWTYVDMLDHIDLRFDATEKQMAFPREIPAWYFDETQFAAHRSQVNVGTSWP